MPSRLGVLSPGGAAPMGEQPDVEGMNESAVVDIVGPDKHTYRIVPLRPSDVPAAKGSRLIGPTRRKVTAGVFSEAGDVMFEVRTIVQRVHTSALSMIGRKCTIDDRAKVHHR